MKFFILLVVVILLASCGNNDNSTITNPKNIDSSLIPKPTPVIAYNIVNVYPHDTTSYTEGLEIFKDKLYESAGDYLHSKLQITDIKTGKIEQVHKISKDTKANVFWEGITIFKGKIYQLTYTNNDVFVYDQNNINKVIKTLHWPYQGWGMTHNDTCLLITDGSANIYFVDVNTFAIKNRITVSDDAGPIERVNELEYVNGYIYSNVYLKDVILKINPSNGKVVGKLDFSGVIEKNAPSFIPKPDDEVLNGIAYDNTTKKFYITGKHWPKLFEISLN